MSELFIPIKFRTSIILNPNEVTKNFDETILKKIKANLENVCTKHGFIKKDSIKIIKRSIGHYKKQHFNGTIIFDNMCIAEICNPAQGSIIKCKVKAKNTMGILAEGFYNNYPILQIIIPKISAGIQSEINIDKVNIGDEIKIEVCGKKFQLFDKHISIIGKAIKNKDENIKTTIIDEENDIVPEEIQEDEILDIDIEQQSIKVEDEDEEEKEEEEEEELDEEFEELEEDIGGDDIDEEYDED
jgi:hypothetical protein